jgi:U3 small nucleolar RNA-associated protein 20
MDCVVSESQNVISIILFLARFLRRNQGILPLKHQHNQNSYVFRVLENFIINLLLDIENGFRNGSADIDLLMILSASLTIVSHVPQVFQKIIGRRLQEFYGFLVGENRSSAKDPIARLAAQTLRALVSIQVPSASIWHDTLALLQNNPANPTVLKAVARVATIYKTQSYAAFGRDDLRKLLPLVEENLKSSVKSLRIATIHLLQLYEQVEMFPDEDGNAEACTIFSICAQIEEIPDTLQTFRQKLILFRRLEKLAIESRRLPAVYGNVLPSFMLGMLTVNFSPLWKEAQRILMAYVGASIPNFNAREATWRAWWNAIAKWDSDAVDSILPDFKALDIDMALRYDSCQDADVSQELGSKPKILLFDDTCVSSFALYTKERIKQFFSAEHMVATSDLLEVKHHRFVIGPYISQLFYAMTEFNPKFASTHAAKFLVPKFFQLYSKYFDCDTVGVADHPKSCSPCGTLLGMKPDQAVKLYLDLFAKFVDPWKSYGSDNCEQLRSIFMEILCRGDPELQRKAFACVLTFKNSALLGFQEELLGVIDDKSFRDKLSVIRSTAMSTVQKTDWDVIIVVLLRVLFGKIAQNHGSENSATQKAKRTAVMSFIAALNSSEQKMFCDLATKPFATVRDMYPSNITSGAFDYSLLGKQAISLESKNYRCLLGFLNFLGDFVHCLGLHIIPMLGGLLTILLHILLSVESQLSFPDSSQDGKWKKKLRELRTLCLRRFLDFFRLRLDARETFDFSFSPFMSSFISSVVQPHLENFSVENAQSPSALLSIFVCWSADTEYLPFFRINNDIMSKVFDILVVRNVKPTVVSCVLDIVENALKSPYGRSVIDMHYSRLLNNLKHYLENAIQDASFNALTLRQIQLLSEISAYATDSELVAQLADLLLPFLKKPDRLVAESVKADIVVLLHNLFSQQPDVIRKQDMSRSPYFQVLSHLFSSFHDREARTKLVNAFDAFLSLDTSASEVGVIIGRLNSYSVNKIDSLDWESRLSAFDSLRNATFEDIPYLFWIPIIHNLVFFVNDAEEMSIRSNGALSLHNFIRLVGSHRSLQPNYYDGIVHIVLPAVKRGMKKKDEVVLREWVMVLKLLVEVFPSDNHFRCLVPLLADGNEEAAFFTNILHLQLHRRGRALRRLSELVYSGNLPSSVLRDVFLPLVFHFVYGSSKKTEQFLVDDGIKVLGAIASILRWSQYYSLLRNQLKIIQKNAELERIAIRSVLAILDSFKWIHDDNERLTACTDEQEECEETPGESSIGDIQSIVVKSTLPVLFKLLEHTDDGDSKLNIRVPIALAYARLLKKLPVPILHQELPRLLLTVAQILRSRSQDVRDTARETLSKMMAILGAKYFPFLIKQLVTALRRGYELHVLCYSLRSILGSMESALEVGDLDETIDQLIPILMNDIFGTVAEEKEVNVIGKLQCHLFLMIKRHLSSF